MGAARFPVGDDTLIFVLSRIPQRYRRGVPLRTSAAAPDN